jgi:ABC-type uncharacterized transport system permease subunit
MFIAILMLAAVAFFAATSLFLNRFVRFQRARSRAGLGAMAIGTALLLGALISGFGHGGEGEGGPLVMLFVTLAAAGGVLLALHMGDFPLVGPVSSAFIGMVALALGLHASFPLPRAPGPLPLLAVLHITATFVGYLLFAPAFVLANLYVAQSWRLKTKQDPNPRLPSLMTLEKSAWRLLAIGFVLFSLGILGGSLTRAGGHDFTLRPQHVVAAIGWLIYAVALWRRFRSGWSGVRSAITLIAGFVVTTGAVLLYVLR